MAQLLYETKTCGRCGGSGHYSRCQMYGTTCFQCRGAKTVTSKAGAAARAKVDAFIAEHFSIAAGDVAIGDRVRITGYTKPKTVLAIEDRPASVMTMSDGATWNIAATRALTIVVNGETVIHQMAPETRLTLALTPERFALVAAFAAGLKGVTLVQTEAA